MEQYSTNQNPTHAALTLIPIQRTMEENAAFATDPLCRETLPMTLDFYKKTGFVEPWICYYAKLDDHLVGNAAFKGQPLDGKIEIAYGTFEHFRRQGIGTAICRLLVALSLQTDPSIIITARTLPEKNHSTKILEKNDFKFNGVVNDPEDGDVWEWIYRKAKAK